MNIPPRKEKFFFPIPKEWEESYTYVYIKNPIKLCL